MGDLRKTPLGKLLLLQALIGGGSSAVERIALGNPATFGTDIARPLVSLEVPFTPIQQGSGDPSPQNVRPIVPWNGLKVGQINGTAPTISNNSGMANADGEWKNTSTDSKTRFDAYIQLYKDSSYIKGAGNKSISASGVYSITFSVDDANCNRIVFLHSGSQNNLSVRFPFNLPQGTYTISFNVVSANPSVVGGLAIKDIFLVEGSTVDRTETDIVFPSPVYGGTLDVVSGVLADGWNDKTVAEIRFDKKADHIFQGYFSDRKYGVGVFSIISDKYKTITAVASTGSTIESLYAQYGDGIYINSGSGTFYICDSNYTDVDAFQTAMADTVVVYELATPTEQTLTGHQITALVGNNTIWSDADGNLEIVYLVSSKYAEEHPVGGLGFGFGFGSGTPDEPDDPENPDEQEEPVVDDSENNQTEGEEP